MSEENNIFEEAFGELMRSNETHKETSSDKSDSEETDVILEEALFNYEGEPMSQDEWEKISKDYIPESIGDEQWEEFVSRDPIPPLNREQEARAVTIGLQEIRKMREYMLHTDRHMMNEYKRIYACYPLLLQKDFEEVIGNAQKELISIMEDMEHLIAGDIDKLGAVKTDFRLYQTFEEKRLGILHKILENYNKRR